MTKLGPSMMRILDFLGDHKPKNLREIVKATGLGVSAAYSSLFLWWKKALLLRSSKVIYEYERRFKGRGGISATTRPYHLYVLRPERVDSLRIDGHDFVEYAFFLRAFLLEGHDSLAFCRSNSSISLFHFGTLK